MPRIKLGDLREAFEFVSFGSPYENNGYISRETGEIFLESEISELEDDLPEDLGNPDRYVDVPHKNELDLGKRLALRFTAEELPDDTDEVERHFQGKGAFGRFKSLLEARGKLEAWYAYEEAATLDALREWAAEAEVEIVEEPAGPTG